MKPRITVSVLALLSAGVMCSAQAQGLFGYKAGGADAPITGGASNNSSTGEAATLEKCEKPFGTVAVVQPQDQVMAALSRYSLPAPTNLLRLVIQQSNCFKVVERGLAMQNLMQERALAQDGQLQQDSNIGRGQMATADFVMTPSVVFNQNDSGGVNLSAFSGMFGALGSVVTSVAGGLKFRQAQTTLMLTDARSSIQVAAAEGNVEKTDWSMGVGVTDFLTGAKAGAYSNTAEGKMVAAALLANYNTIVKTIKDQPSLIQPNGGAASAANAAQSTQANSAAANPGDVLRGKIQGVRVLAEANPGARVAYLLARSDQVVYMGEEQNGFMKVQGAQGEGWVDKKMMTR